MINTYSDTVLAAYYSSFKSESGQYLILATCAIYDNNHNETEENFKQQTNKFKSNINT